MHTPLEIKPALERNFPSLQVPAFAGARGLRAKRMSLRDRPRRCLSSSSLGGWQWNPVDRRDFQFRKPFNQAAPDVRVVLAFP